METGMANEQLALDEYCPKPVRGKVIIVLVDGKRKSKRSELVKPLGATGPLGFGEVAAIGEGVTQTKVGDFVHYDRVLARALETVERAYFVIPEGAIQATEEREDVEFAPEGVDIERVPALLVPGRGAQ